MGFKRRPLQVAQQVRATLSESAGRADRLLTLAKERAGHPVDRLRFACASDITKFYWCGLKSVLDARKREKMFFDIYLVDRLEAALITRRISAIPSDDVAVLEICESFGGEEPPAHAWRHPAPSSPGSRDWEVFEAMRAYAPQGNAMQLGLNAEQLLAQKLPTVRWHFSWNDLLVVCEPDGITDEHVYEFKAFQRSSFGDERRRRAITQAQLGAFLFGRRAIEIEVADLETRDIQSHREPRDDEASITLLNKFVQGERGNPIRPPRPYKCSSCDYLGTPACTISPLQSRP